MENFFSTRQVNYNLSLIVTVLSICFLQLMPMSVFAQKVFSVDYSNQADVKVFVVPYQNQADLCVYKVQYENQAGRNDGNWFFTKYANQADKKIYFVDYENQADVKIFFVPYRNQAGWRNRTKMAFFYK